MERVCIKNGTYSGLQGDAVYLPNVRRFSVSIPNINDPQIKEDFDPKSVFVLGGQRPTPILEKKEFITLQEQIRKVIMIGCKSSCSSSWCKVCFVRKGKSKKIANRLSLLDYKATRQVVLTIDLKKFSGSGQLAYETVKKQGTIHQFIHNLERTSKVKIVDWVWILEWHTAGDPHWHLFIETERGKKGQIGNEILLKHWKHGLVFESYIKSKKHWSVFTDYFSANGYFDPKSNCGSKDKTHQLELPDWAKKIDGFQIRKFGSKCINKNKITDISKADQIRIKYIMQKLVILSLHQLEQNIVFKTQLAACFLNIPKEIINVDIKEQIETLSIMHSGRKESLQKVVSLLLAHQIQKNSVFKNQIAIFILDSLKKISDRLAIIRNEKKANKRNYAERLKSCGQATYCMIYRGNSIRIWKKFNIPYKKFINQYRGYYKPNVGYYTDMDRETFLKFVDRYGISDLPLRIKNNYRTGDTIDYQNPICANKEVIS